MSQELEVLKDYVRREIGYKGELDAEADLLEMKILDSFSIVQLTVFIQEEFNVEFEPEDLTRSNLCSLSKMLALVAKRRTTTQ